MIAPFSLCLIKIYRPIIANKSNKVQDEVATIQNFFPNLYEKVSHCTLRL